MHTQTGLFIQTLWMMSSHHAGTLWLMFVWWVDVCLPRTGSVCLFRTTAASCARGVVFSLFSLNVESFQLDLNVVRTQSIRHRENGKKKKNRSHTLAIFLDLKKQCKSIPCLKYASLIWSPISRMLCDGVPVMCTKDLAAFRVNVDSYETHVTLTGVCVYNRI